MPAKKTAQPETCPVELYARQVAHLLRVRDDTHEDEFGEVTNVGSDYARGMLFQQIEALGVLASYETATSNLGMIFQLMLARYWIFEFELKEEINEKLPHQKETMHRLMENNERAISAATWALLQLTDDPDIEPLRRYFGPVTEEAETHQNKPLHVLVMDYVRNKPPLAA